MKQLYIKPNTTKMDNMFIQVICVSNPSLPGAPQEGSEFNFGTGGKAPKKAQFYKKIKKQL